MTEELFRLDSYLSSCDALVVSADSTGIELDRTVFYATGVASLETKVYCV